MMSVVIVLSGTGPNLLLFSQQSWSASNPKPTVCWRAPFARSLEPEALAKVQFLSFFCVSIKQNKNTQVFLILNMFTIFPFLFLSSASFLDRTSFTSCWQSSSFQSSIFQILLTTARTVVLKCRVHAIPVLLSPVLMASQSSLELPFNEN